jgi:hypothetical protein
LNNNLLDFVAIKDTDPYLIINPDSIKVSKIVAYPRIVQYDANFKMLDGNPLSCRGNNASNSIYVKLFINEDIYMLDKPDNNALFSFDIRVRFINQTIGDHYFAHCADVTSEETSSGVIPYSVKKVIATTPSVLQAMSGLGLNVVSGISENEALAIQNSIDYVYWKMRVKVAKNDYASFAFYVRNYYSDSSAKREASSMGNYILNNSAFATAKAWLLTIFDSVG